MAQQTTASRPLREESEDEKRRREAAQNYLAGRSAYDKARSQGVDMTDVDYGKMSEADFKAEGLRRLDNIKSNFETAALAANKEGINSSKAAQDYLNRGQARIVGDTLVGSAAGISASEWEKRDKSGNNTLPAKDMVNIDRGVRMDQASYDRAIASIDASNKQKADARPNYELAKQSVDRIAKERDAAAAEKAKVSLTRYNNFRQGIDNEGDTGAAFRKDMEDKRESVRLGAAMEQRAARELGDARRAYRAATSAVREAERQGRAIDPNIMATASRNLSAAQKGAGDTNNSAERRDLFQQKALAAIQGSRSRSSETPSNISSGNRVNPYDPPELKNKSSFGSPISMTLEGMSSGGSVTGGMSESSAPRGDTVTGGMSEGRGDTAVGGQMEDIPISSRRNRPRSRLVRGLNLYS
jgi:hypothetical protein